MRKEDVAPFIILVAIPTLALILASIKLITL
jgi:hypothetical protein